MFCPKCATQNPDGGHFCRACGANISLVPQALTGQIPQTTDEKGDVCRPRKPVSLDQAFKNIFMGLGFLVVAIALSRTIGQGWWFWMLLPAFSMMGTGVSQYIRFKDQEKRAYLPQPLQNREFQPPPPRVQVDAPRRQTGELRPPVASVTEGTTRHLGVEAPTRHFENDR